MKSTGYLCETRGTGRAKMTEPVFCPSASGGDARMHCPLTTHCIALYKVFGNIRNLSIFVANR